MVVYQSQSLTENDNTRSTVTNLLVLRSRELDHRLGGRMSNVDLSENGVPVVSKPL